MQVRAVWPIYRTDRNLTERSASHMRDRCLPICTGAHPALVPPDQAL